MQTADRKFSSTAIKRRKVTHLEITPLAEILRYKLIANNIPPEDLKKYFNRRVNLSSKVPQKTSDSETNIKMEW